MTFDSSGSRERFEQELLSRLDGLPTAEQALFGLSACEHLRDFIADLASVAPVADELLTELWLQAEAGEWTADFDALSLEHSVAEHVDARVEDELEALAMQRNAGLGMSLSLFNEWTVTGDASRLVRLGIAVVAEFSEVSALEAAEAAELASVGDWLGGTDVSSDEALHRAQNHGRNLARLARTTWADTGALDAQSSAADILASVGTGALAAGVAADMIVDQLASPSFAQDFVAEIEDRLDDASMRRFVGFLAATTAERAGLWFAPLLESVGYHDWNLVDGFVTGFKRFLSTGGVVEAGLRPRFFDLVERTCELGPVDSAESAAECVRYLVVSGQDPDGVLLAGVLSVLESRMTELGELVDDVRALSDSQD